MRRLYDSRLQPAETNREQVDRVLPLNLHKLLTTLNNRNQSSMCRLASAAAIRVTLAGASVTVIPAA